MKPLCTFILIAAASAKATEREDATSYGAGIGIGPQISAKEIPAPSKLPREALNGERKTWKLQHQREERSTMLIALGALLAIASFFAASALALMMVAAAAGLSVPLLAAMPSASSALFALQLVALEGNKEEAPPPLKDLALTLAWVAPRRPDSTLTICILVLFAVWAARRAAVRLHRKGKEEDEGSAKHDLPHSLEAGAWELRALGLLAFPLAAASTELMLSLDMADSAAAGLVISILVLCFLINQAILAMSFVREAMREGRVLRAVLPQGGGEIFVDRVCDELRALPVSSARPGCSSLFSDWLASPSWCVAPAVASIQEVEFPDEVVEAGTARAPEPPAATWCSGESHWEADNVASVEDELQERPLLEGGGEEEKVDDERDLEASNADGSGRAMPASKEEEVPELLFHGGTSAVKLCHPVVVNTNFCFEVQVREAVAGVTCIPWLDCALPANALRRVEELCGTVLLRAHPGQLAGKISGGHYGVCFDWGTCSPWRWPLELAAKCLFGAWAGMPRNGQAVPPAWSLLIDLVMVFVAACFAVCMAKVKAYEHRNDNSAMRMAYFAAMQVVSIRASWDPADTEHGPLSLAAAGAAGLMLMLPCTMALLAGVGLAGTALSRLEAQGLQDHLLPLTIAGWTKQPVSSQDALAIRSPGICDGGASQGARQDGRDVEVIMPGKIKAFAILLPARSRLQIQHVQLLPPVVGRGGEPEILPPCTATGDRARLPIPPRFLFPAAAGADSSSFEGPSAPPGVVPLAALLSPGRPGRLIYSEAAHNEAGQSWKEAVASFFGMNGSLLADEAERLISEAKGGSGRSRPLVVVEVLPAFASEFMDERHGPEEDACE